MIKAVFLMQKEVKYIVMGLIYTAFFLLIYSVLDYLNTPYDQMSQTYGLALVIINIVLNVVMSLISALMMNLGTAQVAFKSSGINGSNLGFVSVLFGVFTYGCTSCVISFLAAIGIPFMVIALPLAGLPYKLISLGILLLGFGFLLYRIKYSSCKIQ